MSEAKFRELLERTEVMKARAEAALERTAKLLGQSWRRIKQDGNDPQR
ncbi:hypothetical protein [Sphingomonas sp.]